MGVERLRYDGRRALISGGASGMGAATAKLLTELGAEVHVLDIQDVTFPVAQAVRVDLRDPAVKAALGQLHVWPITLEIANAIGKLDFTSDPADELIAATSLHHNVPLVTRDGDIRRSKIVPLAS